MIPQSHRRPQAEKIIGHSPASAQKLILEGPPSGKRRSRRFKSGSDSIPVSLPRRGMHFSCAFGGMQMSDLLPARDKRDRSRWSEPHNLLLYACCYGSARRLAPPRLALATSTRETTSVRQQVLLLYACRYGSAGRLAPPGGALGDRALPRLALPHDDG